MEKAAGGQKAARSRSYLMPFEPIEFLERLALEFGKNEYIPFAQAAWSWVQKELIPTFRFDGQYEDTCAVW